MRRDIFKEVVDFIQDGKGPWPRLDEVVLPDSRLGHDFGMAGDDAADFIEAFFEHFALTPGGCPFHKYFDGEGLTVPLLTPLLYFLWNGKKLPSEPIYDLTVRDLVRCVEAGRWIDPTGATSNNPCTPPIPGKRK